MQRSEEVASLEASHADLLLQVGQTQARMGELSAQLADLEINYRDLEVGLTLAGEDVYQLSGTCFGQCNVRMHIYIINIWNRR